MSKKKLILGVDVSKKKLDVVVLGETKLTTIYKKFNNTPLGFEKIIDFISKNNPFNLEVVLGLESTGIYQVAISNYLVSKGVTVYLLNPNQVLNFKRYKGWLAKTDKIDSFVIAKFIEASENDLVKYIPKSNTEKKLYSYVVRIDQLNKIRTQEINHKESSFLVLEEVEKHILELSEKIEEYKKSLSLLLKTKENQELLEKVEVLTSIKGIAVFTAVSILVFMSEIGTMNRKQITALTGLAPLANDSGSKNGQRHIYGGRKRLRRALFMPSLSAMTNDKILNEVYKRLDERGKPGYKIRVVIMKKMIIRANTLMKEYYKNKAA